VSNVELVQIVVSVDGALCQLTIPPECKHMVLHLIQGMSENKQLNVIKLPSSMQKVSLADVLKAEATQ
jgi:hypothetical protein